MRKTVIVLAALAAASIGLVSTATAGQRSACPRHAMHNGGCFYQSQPQIRRTVIVRKRVVTGYREQVVQRPVYDTRLVKRTIVSQPAPVQTCTDCAVDLAAIYVGCVIKNGQQVWQYRASNSIVYNMSMQRRAEADKIRLLPNGQVTWVKG